jgi:ABC-type glycerol-3-phosphate transport system substrate-binding protein
VFAALILAAACSSKGGGGGSSQSAQPLQGQTFTILGQWTSGEQDAFQAVLNDFNKRTGAVGQYSAASGGDMATVLGTMVSGGNPPDVAMLSLPGAIQQYAAAGKLQPASSTAQQVVKDNFATIWGDLGSANGALYGIPFDASNKSTMWYNTTLFNNAGIKAAPTTWDELKTTAQTLSASGVSVPISIGGGDGWTLTDWFENVYIRTAGLDNYDKLTHHQIPWTDPTVTTALNTLMEIWGDPAMIGSPATAQTVTFTASVDNVFKAQPTSAIVFEGSFVATTIVSDKNPAVVGTDAKVFPFPSVSGSPNSLVGGGDFAVQFSANPAATAFMDYIGSADAAKALVTAPGSGFLSPNKNLDNAAYPNATSAQLAKQIVDAGNGFRFDMSDQAPAAFGGTANAGEWSILQTLLGNGDVAAAQTALEAAAAAVTWS